MPIITQLSDKIKRELREYYKKKDLLKNLDEEYPVLSVEYEFPFEDVVTIFDGVVSKMRQKLIEEKQYLDPEERFDCIPVGNIETDPIRAAMTRRRVETIKTEIEDSIYQSIDKYTLDIKVLYLLLSKHTMAATGEQLRRRQKYILKIKTAESKIKQLHIDFCKQYSVSSQVREFQTHFNVRDIPKESGIYFLFRRGVIIYIGFSRNLHTRLNRHEIVRKYHRQGVKSPLIYVVGLTTDKKLENDYIYMVKPKFNKKSK